MIFLNSFKADKPIGGKKHIVQLSVLLSLVGCVLTSAVVEFKKVFSHVLLWLFLYFSILSTFSMKCLKTVCAHLTFMKQRMLTVSHEIHDMYTATSWPTVQEKSSCSLCGWPWKETGHLQYCRQAELKQQWRKWTQIPSSLQLSTLLLLWRCHRIYYSSYQ